MVTYYLINKDRKIIDEIDGDYQYAYNFFRKRYNINNFEIILISEYYNKKEEK